MRSEYTMPLRNRRTKRIWLLHVVVLSGAFAAIAKADLASGLVLWSKLNNASGTSATDSSGNGNTGTLTNGPVWTDGMHGGAVSFDGVDDFIDVGSDATIDDAFSGTGSFAAWIYIVGWGESGWGRIIDKASTTVATAGWNVQMNSTNAQLLLAVGFSSARGEWTTPSGSLSLNTWYHVAVVYDSDSSANNPTLYINGVAQTVTETRTPSGSYSTDAAISARIGNFAGGTNRTFDGIIDDVRLYNRALTLAEVQTLANGAGLIAHWKLDDGAGTTATDSVSTNDGTLTNGASWTTDGRLCGAVDFNQPDSEYINIPANASLDISTDATITGWFKLDSTFNSSSATSQIILEKYNTNDEDMLIVLTGTDYNNAALTDGALGVKIENGAGGETFRYHDTTTVSWTGGQWYHFAVTIDVSDVSNNKIYINGTDDTDGLGTGGTGGNAIDLNFSAGINIGGKDADSAQLAGARYFNGVIDDIRIYNRILTTAEIQTVAATYTIVDLGSLTSQRSLGCSINDSEQVVGFDENTTNGDSTGWFSQYCAFTGVGTLTGGSESEARGINNSGTVCGWSDNTAGDRKAVTWTSGGGLTDLGTLTGLTDSEALKINSTGQVAGTSLNFGAPSTGHLAFIYLPAPAYSLPAGMTSLGTLGGAVSVAMDLNDSGQVVGGAENASDFVHPFIWLTSTAYGLPKGMNDLGTLGGDNGTLTHRAQAINSSGETVGQSYTAGGNAHAFLWLPAAAYTLSAGMNDLGTLTGGNTSWALDINDSGEVVGTSEVTGGTYRAFIWANGTMTDLNTLVDSNSTWTLTRASGINADGEIVGRGTNPDGNVRGFVLTQSCSTGVASSSALATTAPPASSPPPDGNMRDVFTFDDQGLPLDQVTVQGLIDGGILEVSRVPLSSDVSGGPAMPANTLAGLLPGTTAADTLIVNTDAPAGSAVLTIRMSITAEELRTLGVMPREVMLMVLDEQYETSGMWVPAGRQAGEVEPTGRVGDSGFIRKGDNHIEFWAVRDRGGVFAVGAPVPMDPDVATAPVPSMCGAGLLLPGLIVMGMLCLSRRRSARSQRRVARRIAG